MAACKKFTVITANTEFGNAVTRAMYHRVTSQAKNDTEILYYYCVEMCKILKPDGFWSSPDPAPLTVEQIREAFERVKKHPAYKGQSLVTRTPQGRRVAMVNGRISETDEEDQGWTLPPLKD